MKKAFCLFFIVFLMLSLSACQCEHVWQKADCTQPKTCLECGETEGEVLKHTWVDATCTEPKTCKVCSITKGEPLSHDFDKATCQKPMECKRCQATEGEKSEHSYVEYVCEYCSAEDTVGKKTNPKYSFVEKQYTGGYVDGENYYYLTIGFKDIMGNGGASYTSDITKAIHTTDPEIIDGTYYYWTGGSAGMNDWYYHLTDTEILIYSNGEIIGKFTLNEDGSIYCTYGDHYCIVTGVTYY